MLQGHGQTIDGLKPPKPPYPILVALGANLASAHGRPDETLHLALDELRQQGAVIRNTSPFYHTPAFPVGNGPDYVNAAAYLEADWSAHETLEVLHRIEAQMGRARERRWGQRTLDLDLVAYGQTVLPDLKTHAEWRNLPLGAQMTQTPQSLILPHPRMHERAFVLVPLADVAADWQHPILKMTVQQMRDALDPALLAEVTALQ